MACVGLRPRTTLEGSRFNAAEVGAIRLGLAEPDVRAIIGEPFEVTAGQQGTVWRYYERFTPRGCDPNPPVISQEFRVTFLAGRVVSTEPSISAPAH
jgi:hypothetical protein